MRGFGIFLFSLIFFFTFLSAVLAFSFSTLLSPTYVKNTLNNQDIYQVAAKNFPQLVIASDMDAASKKSISAFLKKEVTPAFLQAKVETFTDDTFYYLNGTTESLPTLSLSELLPKLKKAAGGQTLPKELTQGLSKPIPLPKDVSYEQIRQDYTYLKQAPLYLGIISLLALLVVAFLPKGVKHKMRSTSLAIFLPSVVGIVVAIALMMIGSVIGGIIIDSIKSNAGDVASLSELMDTIRKLFNTITQDLFKNVSQPFALSLIVAGVLFVASFFFKKNEAPEGYEVPKPKTEVIHS